MTLGKQIIVLATLCLAMRASRTYALTPEEFAVKEGANKNLVNELSDACKTADNPEHCFGIGLSISKAESQMGNDPKAISHGYFGRVASKDKSAYGFVNTYKKKYYIVNKYNEGGMFYGYGPKNPAPTSYCMSETSSNSVGHCPNGRASFNFIYSKYRQEVMGDDKQEVAKVELKRPELKKVIASKQPIAGKKRCKVIYKATTDGFIQIDRLQQFWNRIRGVKANDVIFRCRGIQK